MEESNANGSTYYVCPYCGRRITKDNILFFENDKSLYTDNVRGGFLRLHGVRVPENNRFGRKYFEVNSDNVTTVDDNGFPIMIEDSLKNAKMPEELPRPGRKAPGGAAQLSQDEDGSSVLDFGGNSFDADTTDEADDVSAAQVKRLVLRACPHCHCELPQQFGLLPVRHVALFGGRASGKTAYIVNLFQQLSSQLQANNLGAIEIAAESKAFLDPMIEDYEKNGVTPPTAAAGALMPILLRYRRKDTESFIVLYDIAGEGTIDPQYMADHDGIRNCETLMLMIDPNMFANGAFFQAWVANRNPANPDGQDLNTTTGCCTTPVDEYLMTAGGYCQMYAKNVRNVICIVTKLDMLLTKEKKYFSEADIEITKDMDRSHKDHVSLKVLMNVRDNLDTYLENCQYINLMEKISETFGNLTAVDLLGVSTSTVSNSRTGFAFNANSSKFATKHRIIEPFLVMLMRFGMVTCKTADGKVVAFNGMTKQQQIGDGEEKEKKEEKKKETRRGWFGRQHKEDKS